MYLFDYIRRACKKSFSLMYMSLHYVENVRELIYCRISKCYDGSDSSRVIGRTQNFMSLEVLSVFALWCGARINRTRVFFNERSEMPQCHFTRQLTRSTLVGIGAKRRPCNVIFIGTQIARATVLFHLRSGIFPRGHGK